MVNVDRFTVEITVIEKVSQPHISLFIECTINDTIGILRNKILSQLNQTQQIAIAFKGKLLTNDSELLSTVNAIPNPNRPTPKLFVTFTKRTISQSDTTSVSQSTVPQTQTQQNQNNQNSLIPNPNPNPPQNGDNVQQQSNDNVQNQIEEHDDVQQQRSGAVHNEEDDEKMCRFCFGTDETDPNLGRLFSPCRCSGSMKYIHVGCLNQWRAFAPQNRSQFVCDQCSYAYNIQRAKWALFLESQSLSYAVATMLLIIGVVVTGLALYHSRLNIAKHTYRYIEWDPIAYFSRKLCVNTQCNNICNAYNLFGTAPDCPNICRCRIDPHSLSETMKYWIEVLSCGVLLLGLFGLWIVRHLLWRGRFMFVLTLSQSLRVLRLFLLVGLAHSFWGLLGFVRRFVKLALYRFGEQILEVNTS